MKKRILHAFVCVACIVIGYVIAILTFSITVRINKHDGKISNKISIFPFTKNCDHGAASAFHYLYGIHTNAKFEEEDLLVEELNFRPLKINSSKRGQYLLMAHNNLLVAYRLQRYNEKEREKIGIEFISILESEGVMKAYEYTQDLLYEP